MGITSILELAVGFFGAGTLFAVLLCAAGSDAEPYLGADDHAERSEARSA